MAISAVSVTRKSIRGQERVRQGTFTLSGSYTSGGDTLTPGMFGLNRIKEFRAEAKNGIVFRHDRSTNPTKLQALLPRFRTHAATTVLVAAGATPALIDFAGNAIAGTLSPTLGAGANVVGDSLGDPGTTSGFNVSLIEFIAIGS